MGFQWISNWFDFSLIFYAIQIFELPSCEHFCINLHKFLQPSCAALFTNTHMSKRVPTVKRVPIVNYCVAAYDTLHDDSYHSIYLYFNCLRLQKEKTRKIKYQFSTFVAQTVAVSSATYFHFEVCKFSFGCKFSFDSTFNNLYMSVLLTGCGPSIIYAAMIKPPYWLRSLNCISYF